MGELEGLAERVGFEPTNPFRLHDFESCAFDQLGHLSTASIRERSGACQFPGGSGSRESKQQTARGWEESARWEAKAPGDLEAGAGFLSRLYRTDFHVHTNLSDCGAPEATPKALLKAGRAAGLEAIGFADHVFLPAHRERSARLRKMAPKQFGDMRVYVGCEADVLSPTQLAIDEEFALTLDYVLVAASHLYEPRAFHPVEGMNAQTMADYLLATMNLAVDSGLCDILVHPFVVPISLFRFEELVAVADPDGISRLGEKAARAGVAMEYNPRVLRLYPEAARWLYGRLLETGVKVAINSDTHFPGGVGFHEKNHATREEMLAEGIPEEQLWGIRDRVSAGRRGVAVD